jgi:hypothetical protein
MRAITASFVLEIPCLLTFQSHIGLLRRSQPPPTYRIMQTNLSIRGFCHASGLIQMSFPIDDFSKTVWSTWVAKGQNRNCRWRANCRIKSQPSMKHFEQLVDGEIEEGCWVAAFVMSRFTLCRTKLQPRGFTATVTVATPRVSTVAFPS